MTRSLNVRTRLFLVVLLAFVPILASVSYHTWEDRQDEIRHARELAESVFELAVLNEDQGLAETKELLASIAQILEVEKAGPACGRYLAGLLNTNPRYLNLGVIDTEGYLICSAVPYSAPLFLGDREYFRAALIGNAFSVGTIQVGRVTGKTAVNFGYPISGENGVPAGVVFAALNLSYATEVLDKAWFRMPAGTTFTKIDGSGGILNNYPYSLFTGGTAPERGLVATIIRYREGEFIGTGPDGEDWMYLYAPIWEAAQGDGAYLLLSIPLKNLLAESVSHVKETLLLLGLVASITLISVWWIVRRWIVDPVQVLVKASNQLASGNLSARVRPSSEDELGALGAAFDNMAEELERKNRKLSLLDRAVEQTADAVLITDKQGKIEYVNPAFEKTTGYTFGEIAGKTPAFLRSGKHDDELYSKLWETISLGRVWTGEFVNRRKDGSFYNEEATISPVRDATGEIVNFVASTRDITKELALREQVEVAQRMEAVGTLAGGIAHDFNNALTGIIGFAEMAKLRVGKNSEISGHLDEVLRGAERAATLTRQLLAYSRRQIMNPTNVSLNAVVMDLTKLLSKLVGENITVVSKLTEDLPSVRADRGQLEQVLMNLVLNSRDAMPGGGQVVVKTSVQELTEGYVLDHPYMHPGRFVVLSVSDSGMGMDAETRERVFEPFFTTKGPDKGSGLGMSVVFGIVKQHGGFIHLYSEVAKGTTVRIYLPAVDAPAEEVLPGQTSIEARGGSETILVAEDSDSVRAFIQQILGDLGYTVLPAANGAEALELFERHREKISLAVLDVVMPGQGGKETFAAMQRLNQDLKVIYMSGYTEDAVHVSFVLTAGVPFLQKPFPPSALSQKVREALDERKGPSA